MYNDTDISDRDAKLFHLYAVTSTIQLCIGCFSGYIGNISVCLVIIFNKSMHKTTNYYILNLAISNILGITSFGIGWLLLNVGVSNKFIEQTICTTNSLLGLGSSYVTFLTITTMSLIVKNMVSQSVRQRVHGIWKTKRAMICIWIFGFLLVLPKLYVHLYLCKVIHLTFSYFEYYLYITSVIYFTLNMIIFAIIGVVCYNTNKFRKINRLYDVQQPTDGVHGQNWKMFKILVAIVVILFICWTPTQIISVWSSYYHGEISITRANMSRRVYLAQTIAFFIFNLFKVINPFIYIIFWDQFREGLKNIYDKVRKKSEESANEDIRLDVQN